ncbi:hypothetical protein PHLCEN_2v11295 [Hermanssonia centrifuga]|uniref:Amidase domain-containing protein n=1 Tax=Hermanssonia centrifuga TaxID=98765 RepID=A0A2R6NKN3_9APHY|nr:hypothetical protein PHLCEN_2v11295 [Hermanssonia centrifuga]
MDGSALGWGTDVGGSLRIPASYCGIYSFKPGNGRVGTMGAVGMLFLVFKNLDERLILGIDCIPGFEAVRTVCGPMGRSVEDLELACRVVFGLSSQNYGPAPLPFRAHELPERLKFGYYTSEDVLLIIAIWIPDNFIKPSPVCQRAVLQTVEALRREGHECIEFTVPEPSKPMELFLALISSDGNKTLFAPIGPDPQVRPLLDAIGLTNKPLQQAELATVALGPKLYGWLRSFAAWFIERSFDDRICANLLRASRKKSVDDFWRICSEAKEYARMFNQEVWEKHQFDGIIAPVQAMPALPHESVAYVGSLSCPTVLYNIVDSPVGTIPVTRVDPVLDSLTEEWSNPKVGTGHGSPLVERLLYRGEGAMYNAQKMAGLPVGVQVVGKKWEEEKVIEMMKVVDRVLGQRGFGPGCWSSQKQ